LKPPFQAARYAAISPSADALAAAAVFRAAIELNIADIFADTDYADDDTVLADDITLAADSQLFIRRISRRH
jgi:hypothetical protein